MPTGRKHNTSLTKRLRALASLEKKKETRQQVAARLGISLATIASWVKNKEAFRAEALAASAGDKTAAEVVAAAAPIEAGGAAKPARKPAKKSRKPARAGKFAAAPAAVQAHSVNRVRAVADGATDPRVIIAARVEKAATALRNALYAAARADIAASLVKA